LQVVAAGTMFGRYYSLWLSMSHKRNFPQSG